MEQPTTPAEPHPEQQTNASERGRHRAACERRHTRRLHHARLRRRARAPVAHLQPRREHRRARRDPRRLDALPRRRRALAAARRARDLGHARRRARHVRPPRPPLHPVAEPVRRRQVVPQGGHVAAPPHRVLALRLALHDRLPDAVRRDPVPARRPARRSRELRGTASSGPSHRVTTLVELLERADRRRPRAAALHPRDQPHDRRDLHRADGADGGPADEVVRARRRQLGRRDRPRARPGRRQGRGHGRSSSCGRRASSSSCPAASPSAACSSSARRAPARRCSRRRSPPASTRRSWPCPARASRRRSSAWTSWPCSGWATRPRSSRASGAATASSSSTRSTPSACAAPRSAARAREPLHTEMPMFGPRGTRTASGDVIIESREWRDYIGAQMADADRPVVRRGPISTDRPRRGAGHVRRRPGQRRAQPAARRHGRRRQPALPPAHLDALRQHAPGRLLRRAAAHLEGRPAPAAAQAAQRSGVLHRRDQRPAGRAGSGAHARRAHGPPGAVPHPQQGRPRRRARLLPRQGRAHARPRR